MTQSTPQPQPQPQPKSAPAPFRPAPLASVPSTLAAFIAAAASGDRSAIYYLFAAVFASARAAVRCLAEQYNAHPRQRTFDTYARLKYCFARIPAILYTLQHAPERFLTPAQLRALTRARAVLAHIWRQPVDFSPLTPWLTSPENCPPPPRSVVAPASCRPEPSHTLRSEPRPSEVANSVPSEPDASLATPRSALRTSSANPLLLNSPGRALAAVLLQLTAIYGLSASPVSVPRPSQSSSNQAAPAASPHVDAPAGAPHSISNPCAPHAVPRAVAQPTIDNQQFFSQPPP